MGHYSQALEEYFSLMKERPDLFRNHGNRGIEILTSRDAIDTTREAVCNTRQSAGQDVGDLRVGLLARDPYMIILRDAVCFPDGTLGLYNRIVELPCVAVLPLLDSRPVMIRIFRHGLRNWSLEFPRGGCDPGESPEEAVRRELLEEIGADIVELIPLGDFTPGGASLSIHANLFAARIGGIGAPDRSDGIDEIQVIEVADVERLIGSSQIIDGFTLATFLRARLAGII